EKGLDQTAAEQQKGAGPGRQSEKIEPARALKTKTAAEIGGRFHVGYRDEDISFLAGLAATYSSKSRDLVPSALGSFTAEFEMGSGTGPPLKPPVRPRTNEASVSEANAQSSGLTRGPRAASAGLSFSVSRHSRWIAGSSPAMTRMNGHWK